MSRAEGGTLPSSLPYLVGEKGPELVVPAQAGTVVALCGCGHSTFLHDIYEMGDPYPTCCVDGCKCGHPGDAVMTRHDDGTVTVERADPVIRVTLDLLRDPDMVTGGHYDPETQTLTLDTAGEYVYDHLRPDPQDSRVALFGRRKAER